MKKIAAIVLAFLLCFVCFACNNQSDSNNQGSGGSEITDNTGDETGENDGTENNENSNGSENGENGDGESGENSENGNGENEGNENGDDENGNSGNENGDGENENGGEDENPVKPQTPSEKYTKVIILSGQSNALGCTYFEYLQNKISAERYSVVSGEFEHIRIIQEAEAKKLTDFVPVKAGQGNDPKDGRRCFGPELGIAEALSSRYADEDIYIVKFAVGGSSLHYDWVTSSRGQTSYNTACLNKYISAALKVLTDAGLNPKIAGFCWMQGEADATHIYYNRGDGMLGATLSNVYENNLKAFINDMRALYNGYALDGSIMNFIDAYINNHANWEYHQTVNNAKLNIHNMDINHNYVLDTLAPNLVENGIDGLISNTEGADEVIDVAHYDSVSMLKLGNMFGEQIAAICG